MATQKRKQTYPLVLDYLAEFDDDYEGPAVVSRSMAAKALNTSRAAVEGMLSRGQLDGPEIEGVQCVYVADLVRKVAAFNGLVAVATAFLEAQALEEKPVTYAPIMQALGMRSDMPADRRKVGQVLDAVSRRTLAKLRKSGSPDFLLSALVHRKATGASLPSEGFFKLAEALEFRVRDREQFVADHLGAIYAYYRRRQRRAA